MLPVCALAVPIGAVAAVGAWCLLRLIGLCTNVFFYGRASTDLVAPGGAHHPWLLILLVPIAGGLVVGLMARYGSEKIRGHGMPEAIEAILTGGSRVQPRVALLKPISAAISIGSGGPFGAEGPIIMTGGALGSIAAQHLRLTADERKTLLVAGAAAGMAATFNAPLASVLLAVELLLFEWRPRSMIPVAIAVITGTAVRWQILGAHAVFAVPGAEIHAGDLVLLCCVLAGVATGLLGMALTGLVYAAEDAFARLPVHWMWWPAIGGLVIGLGGLVEPRALGVGYDVISELLQGRATMSLIVGILVVKSVIWSLSLGSGTSGGVLAPMFMIGGALGALGAHVLPGVEPGFWPLVCLAGVIGGVMRAPFTAVAFSCELTGRWDAILPLLIAATAAYLLTALLLKRSVLTEKVARRGFHLTREYDVDPLVVLFVREVMDVEDIVVHDAADSTLAVLEAFARESHETTAHRQRLYPVVGDGNALLGVLTRRDLLDLALLDGDLPETVGEAMTTDVVFAHPDETLRDVAYRMAETSTTRMPVVTRGPERRLVGIITLPALLAGRLRDLEESRDAQRVMRVAAPRRRRVPARSRSEARAARRYRQHTATPIREATMSNAVAAALRPVPRTATRRLLAIATVAAAFASVPAIAPATTAHHGAAHETIAPARSAKALALHDGMRKLWEDHITWTRLAIISFAQDLPDLPQTEARLLRNQTDIGNAIEPYYGRRAGNALTTLLKEHITGAVDLLAAARAGDPARLATAKAAWYDNGNRIAAFLHRANPHHWGLRDMRTMMRLHLDETLDEAVARLQGRFDADIRAYDAVHHHILAMADMLTDGIVAQFPRRF